MRTETGQVWLAQSNGSIKSFWTDEGMTVCSLGGGCPVPAAPVPVKVHDLRQQLERSGSLSGPLSEAFRNKK